MRALKRAIELENIQIIILLLNSGANPRFGKMHQLPTVFHMQLQQKQITSRFAETVMHHYHINRNNPRITNGLIPHLKALEALLAQEKKLLERYQV